MCLSPLIFSLIGLNPHPSHPFLLLSHALLFSPFKMGTVAVPGGELIQNMVEPVAIVVPSEDLNVIMLGEEVRPVPSARCSTAVFCLFFSRFFSFFFSITGVGENKKTLCDFGAGTHSLSAYMQEMHLLLLLCECSHSGCSSLFVLNGLSGDLDIIGVIELPLYFAVVVFIVQCY